MKVFARKTNLKQSFSRREQGQSLIEFSLCFLVILLILGVTIDLGRMAFTLIGLRDAAQEGLSYGIINPNNCAEIAARASAALENTGSQSPSSVTVTIDGVSCESAPAAQVCAGHEMNVVTNLNFNFTSATAGILSGKTSTPIHGEARGTILTPICTTP